MAVAQCDQNHISYGIASDKKVVGELRPMLSTNLAPLHRVGKRAVAGAYWSNPARIDRMVNRSESRAFRAYVGVAYFSFLGIALKDNWTFKQSNKQLIKQTWLSTPPENEVDTKRNY